MEAWREAQQDRRSSGAVGGSTHGEPGAHRRWPRDAAARVDAAAGALAACSADDFELVLSATLAEVGAGLGLAALGERTEEATEGVVWVDPSAVAADELTAVDHLLVSTAKIAGGPFSVIGATPRPVLALPTPTSSFGSVFVALAPDPEGFTPDEVSLLGLLASAVSSARQRVAAVRLLEERLANQELLNSLSALAATDEPTALGDILVAAETHYDIGAVTVWMFDGLEAVLHASSADHYRDLDVGSLRVPIRLEAIDRLFAEGHVFATVADFKSTLPFAQPDDAGVLLVPVHGPSGIDGVMSFVDPASRAWSDHEIESARSIARSVRKLIERTQSSQAAAEGVAAERMLRDVAAEMGAAIHAQETATIDGALGRLSDHFDLTGAALWRPAPTGDAYQLVRGRLLQGEASRHGDVLVDLDLGQLDTAGVVATCTVGSVHPQGLDESVLVVALRAHDRPAGVLTMAAAPGRVWNEAEINIARTFATFVDQTMARFAAEHVIHRRLELEGLVRRIAGWAVDAHADTADEVLDDVVTTLANFFGLAEAQIWKIADERAHLQAFHRPDGRILAEHVSIAYLPSELVERRGWAVLKVADVVDLWDGEPLDPHDSRLLITSYAGPDAALGMIVLIDPTRRHWDEEELAAIRSIADTIGQLQSRINATRALEWQNTGRDLLNHTATSFINATTHERQRAVQSTVERMREHIGCDSLAVFMLNRRTVEIDCLAEATVDGEPLQAGYAPMKRDSPVIARLLEPGDGPEWRLSDLFGLPESSEPTNLLVFPSVRGRDIVIVSAAQRGGAAFPEGGEATLRGLSGLLTQFFARLSLEQGVMVRSDADRMLGDVAADFVERSLEDAEQGVHRALEQFATLFGLRTVTLWRGAGLSDLRPVTTFQTEDDALDPGPLLPGPHVARALATDPQQVLTFQPGAEAPHPSVAHHTVLFAPVVDQGVIVGALSSTDSRPMHLVPDLEIQRDFMEATAQLIRQLWRRLASDTEIDRKLASDDLLRQFATRLVTAPPGRDPGEALGWLASRFGLDHASMWRVAYDGEAVNAEVLLQYGASEVLRIPQHDLSLRVVNPSRAEVEGKLTWFEYSVDADRPAVHALRDLLELRGPRRVGFIVEPDGTQLFFTCPGVDPIPDHVMATMVSALSILSQHEARHEAERALASAFSAAPIGICMRDRETRLISCNDAYAELTGRSEADLLGTELSTVLAPEQTDEILGQVEAVAPGEELRRETAYRRPDGSIVWARVRSTAVVLPGQSEPVLFTYCEDVTESRRARQLLEYQATHDELTGLPNRRAIVADIADELAHGRDCAVLILDLDRFKLVNDSLGHSAGDTLLITCADRIRLSVRPGDTVCRLGGDEFAILLRSPADAGAATAVAERLLRLLADPVRIDDEEVFTSASVGIAIPDPGDVVEDLVRHADAAMYEAKAQGRGRSVVFDRSMRDSIVARVRTETELRRAIEHGQFEVHYQPEFVLGSGRIVGTEALLRWRHPERGLLTAGAFIDVVEDAGLVMDVGRWVLGQATAQAARWIDEGHDLTMRVNLSARQLRPAVVSEVRAALAAAGLPPEHLCLELTETVIMDDVKETARILQEFRDLGVQVAIDDFGTGFSSLAYLKRFPVDILKIDRTFVDGLGVDPDDTAIVRSIIGLAHTLRLEVVAEGVEEPAQIAELTRLGCNRGQGFHLAHPAPPGDIERLFVDTAD